MTFSEPGALDLRLDRRWFALFLVVQAVLLAGSLLYSRYLLILGAIGVALALFSVLVLLYPWLIVPVIVATTGLDSTGRLGARSGNTFYLTGFHLAFVLTIIAIGANVSLRRRIHFPDFELKLPLLMLLGCIGLSLAYSPNQPEATIGFVRIACLILFTYMAEIILDSKQALSAVVWSMALVTVGGAAMGAYQVITGQFSLPARVIEALGGTMPRATGTFGNPNIFATFLMSGILPLIALLLNCRTRLATRAVFVVATLVGLGGLLATFSRSNWLATMAGIVTVLYLSQKLRYLFIFSFLAVLAVLGLKEFVPFAEYIFERFTSIFTFFEQYGTVGRTSGTARVLLVVASLNMFLAHPVLGIGWRGFPKVFSAYAPRDYPWWSHVNEPHTVVTTILAELGLVGFVAFAWFVGQVLRDGLRGLREMQDGYLRALLIGMLSSFVAIQVSQTFNGNFGDNTFWFYLGMLYATIRLDRRLRAA